ncbi:MAG: N-acetylneuraminate synthase family protein [Desulfobacteraceae bacterium]|jgi:N-acetylneuraminate synthase
MDADQIKSPTIKIANCTIGPRHPCLIIAEIGQAHDGSLGTAHAYIDAAAGAGADAIKFQTHIADAESTPRDVFRVKFSYQDATRRDYWKRMEFTPEQWAGLAAHAREKGLLFLSSAFSEQAVAMLDSIGMPAWKVASGEIATKPLLEQMAATTKPLLISTGMASWRQIDQSLGWLSGWNTPYALFQCTTAYPCPPDRWGLNLIGEIRERYRCPVGFSDHSGGIFAGLAAAALGIDLLEVHITFSRNCFGPDVPASLTIEQFAQLVTGVRGIEAAVKHPLDKNVLAETLSSTLDLFSKSIVAAKEIPAGKILAYEDLAFKKPGGRGIPASDYETIIGRKIKKTISGNELVTEDHVDGFE